MKNHRPLTSFLFIGDFYTQKCCHTCPYSLTLATSLTLIQVQWHISRSHTHTHTLTHTSHDNGSVFQMRFTLPLKCFLKLLGLGFVQRITSNILNFVLMATSIYAFAFHMCLYDYGFILKCIMADRSNVLCNHYKWAIVCICQNHGRQPSPSSSCSVLIPPYTNTHTHTPSKYLWTVKDPPTCYATIL